MHGTTANPDAPFDVTILARVLGNGRGPMSEPMAHYLLSRGFDEHDQTRMHELTVRNQGGELSADDKDELAAYVKIGTVLSILKSKARVVLRGQTKRRAKT